MSLVTNVSAWRLIFLLLLAASMQGDLIMSPVHAADSANGATKTYQLVVMDPLAAPLSCPCVEGYAQRKYEFLVEFLQQRTGDHFELTFVESLAKFREKKPDHRPDLVIGKDSVIRFDAKKIEVPLHRIAYLTDQQGETTQHGLFVVRSGDTARSVADLANYRILFGGPECDEKYRAALTVLTRHGVSLPEVPETCNACSDGATRILEMKPDEQGATVISSYAAPLLEGCGTIKKGDLRVIGKTELVPFVAAYLGDQIAEEQAGRWVNGLLAVAEDAELCVKLETLLGFVVAAGDDAVEVLEGATGNKGGRGQGTDSSGPSTNDASNDASNATWPAWRGPRGDAHCPRLPARFDESPKIVWSEFLATPGLGGIAADENYVVIGDRDLEDQQDVFRCFDAPTGVTLWEVSYPAPGKLDYGNTPRATPRLDGTRVYLVGALGHVRAVELATGTTLWHRDLWNGSVSRQDRPWGYCASPLLIDGHLIVHPGTPDAAIMALDSVTGNTIWKSSGPPPRYGSFVARQMPSHWQIIGHDEQGLAGWNSHNGDLLWRIALPDADDFNVSTPVNVGPHLLIASENNGTRLYRFNDDETLNPEPIAKNPDLAPDMSSPVVAGDRIFCAWHDLFCLDAKRGLTTIWKGTDPSILSYAPLITDNERLLLVGRGGNLLLVDARSDTFQIISRLDVLADQDAEIYSHPALVENRLYLRGESELVCVDLASRTP